MILSKERLKVFKVREGAKLPVRAHPSDAGMDLFFCPDVEGLHSVLRPNQTALLETGLKIGVPQGYMLQIMNKSGIASKRRLVTGACVVDAGYDGEIYVNLHNIGDKIQVIEPGQKIAQAVLIPISLPEIEETLKDRVYDSDTARGDGAFGSTGDK